MHEYGRFSSQAASVTAARHWLRRHLDAAGLDERTFDAELCLSELAANAVCHAHTTFEVDLREIDGNIRIAVRDQSHEPVQPRIGNRADATTGRGLQIVAAVARDWGVIDHVANGKTVWCTLSHS